MVIGRRKYYTPSPYIVDSGYAPFFDATVKQCDPTPTISSTLSSHWRRSLRATATHRQSFGLAFTGKISALLSHSVTVQFFNYNNYGTLLGPDSLGV
jgi:hypothetical protein